MTSPLNVVGKAHEATGSGDFVWFVYGSSLDVDAFGAWAEQHGYRVPDLAGGRRSRLVGYRLAFDAPSRTWGGAVASLLESPGDSVEGLAVRMPGEARGLVDHKEGAISGLYAPFEVSLDPLDGTGPLRAVAYRTAPGRALRAEEAPSPTYLEVLLKGARAAGLSSEWVAHLESLRR